MRAPVGTSSSSNLPNSTREEKQRTFDPALCFQGVPQELHRGLAWRLKKAEAGGYRHYNPAQIFAMTARWARRVLNQMKNKEQA